MTSVEDLSASMTSDSNSNSNKEEQCSTSSSSLLNRKGLFGNSAGKLTNSFNKDQSPDKDSGLLPNKPDNDKNGDLSTSTSDQLEKRNMCDETNKGNEVTLEKESDGETKVENIVESKGNVIESEESEMKDVTDDTVKLVEKLDKEDVQAALEAAQDAPVDDIDVNKLEEDLNKSNGVLEEPEETKNEDANNEAEPSPIKEEMKNDDEEQEVEAQSDEQVADEATTTPNNKKSASPNKNTSTPSVVRRTSSRRQCKQTNTNTSENSKTSKSVRNKEKESPIATPTGRRSLRARRSIQNEETEAIKTPTKSTRKRGKKQSESKEETNDEAGEPMEVEMEVKNIKSRKSNSGKKQEEDFDPYDLNTEIEKHPEPLKNIQMEVQNFGAVKYAKIGSSSTPRYQFTEKAAESRISNLSNSAPQRRERKSLAEMTPGKEKVNHKTTTGILTSSSKRKRPQISPENQKDKRTEEKEVEDSTPKRKKPKAETQNVSSSKKKNDIALPQLSSEEQWKVDHPGDDHEPHAPGARVFAIFGKVYYPAIIGSERDALGRYKVQFTADKIVKDVPAAGIIPLRAVVSGKPCFYNDDVVNVIACPNAASAEEWNKGIFSIDILDEDGESTGEAKEISWSDISLDMNDWKEYINRKSFEASSIASENITTPAQMSRARKSAYNSSTPSSSSPSNSKLKSKIQKSALASSETSTVLEMNEKAVGKNIFKGMIFMTTSAKSTTGGRPVAIKKKHLQEFLENNGAIVTEDMNEIEHNDSGLDAFLISDMYYRTHKYLSALAKNIRCVSNEWILQCSLKGEVIDHTPYLLPAGISIIDNKIYPLPKNADKLLEGEKFLVHSMNDARSRNQDGSASSFLEIWKPMVESLGAESLNVDENNLEGVEYDYLLTDSTALENIIEHSKNINAKIISSEWVIQSLIMGRKLDVNAHQKFHPSFGKNEATN